MAWALLSSASFVRQIDFVQKIHRHRSRTTIGIFRMVTRSNRALPF